ncbi:uncharacterized protein LOC119403576 [Rhipicephalus sanguineus]|uniref:uncharacterized protein LOC119403576 n=1 Tax=Rhipicephalus sanguineus TaxID=34632 RepID=UPI00189518B9|nr:uncharacterized protein LOC119403576 [Rhipicephalus sanguineus]
MGLYSELIDELRDKDSALAELDRQIAYALDDEEFDEEIMDAIEYHEKIVKAVNRLRSALGARASVGPTLIEANQSRHAWTRDGSSNSMGAAHSDVTSQNLNDQRRPRAPGLEDALPNLQVPIFSGESSQWPGFWEHYEATINTHPDPTGIEKFEYLKTYLAGTAKRAIELIQLNEANNNIAAKVLIERYGRKDLLIEDHTDSLLAI